MIFPDINEQILKLTTNPRPLLLKIAQDCADYHDIRFDAKRDAQDAQLVKDELTFVKEYLPGHAQDMIDNCDSLDDIGAWLDLEFADWQSDLNHDRRR